MWRESPMELAQLNESTSLVLRAAGRLDREVGTTRSEKGGGRVVDTYRNGARAKVYDHSIPQWLFHPGEKYWGNCLITDGS